MAATLRSCPPRCHRLAASLLVVVAPVALLAGCSAASAPAVDPPAGPIVYPLVSARLRALPEPASSRADPGVVAAVSPTAAAAGEIVNFATEASSALGPIMTVGKPIEIGSGGERLFL